MEVAHKYPTRRGKTPRKSLEDIDMAAVRTSDGPLELTSGGQPIPVFMTKVYAIVDTSEPDVVGWSESGDSFLVRNATEFSKSVLPRFFRHSNYSSFIRQLNFYGFRSSSMRLPECKKKRMWEFSHPHFRRGCKDDLALIRRKTCSEATGGCRASAPAAHHAPV